MEQGKVINSQKGGPNSSSADAIRLGGQELRPDLLESCLCL